MNYDIATSIKKYIQDYPSQNNVSTRWGDPLIGFAAAEDPLFSKLKEIVSPSHVFPHDLLSDAKTVIAYFLPFSEDIVSSNHKGLYSSKEWAIAYIETNELIANLNKHIHQECAIRGYESTVIPATHNFDEERLISDWSHRHVAWIAGLGNFGLNNMLITVKGCAGRLGSIVTNLSIEPTQKVEREYCLYKAKGTCRICLNHCGAKALQRDSFNRHKCYEILLENDKIHTDLGLTDVCGKCVAGLPCTFKNPVSETNN